MKKPFKIVDLSLQLSMASLDSIFYCMIPDPLFFRVWCKVPVEFLQTSAFQSPACFLLLIFMYLLVNIWL